MADRHPPSPCGAPPVQPERPDNRAGLDQIAYRITTQPEAFARMCWQLPRQTVRAPGSGAALTPLEALRSRDLSDPTISLLDAWAMATDVLSFYSERIAQEGYLGTATQRRSVQELARLIGYELAPGVAAGTYLAFTVEASDDPYRAVEVTTGVQAMSIPARKDELPQIFETLEPITARAEWNEIHARTQRPQHLVLYLNLADAEDPLNGQLYLFDLDGSFDASALADPDLIALGAEAALAPFHPLRAGLDLAAALADRIDDHASNPEIAPQLQALPVDEVYLFGLGLNLRPGARVLAVAQAGAGGDAGPVVAQPLRVVSAREDKALGLTAAVLSLSGKPPERVRRAPLFRLANLRVGQMPATRLTLDSRAVDTHLRRAAWSGDGLSALVQAQAWPRARLMTLTRRLLDPEPEAETALGLHVMRETAGFFGATAPLWETVDYGEGSKGPYTRNWDGTLLSPPNAIWTDALGNLPAGPAQVFLDREVDAIQPGGWAVLEAASGATLGLRVTHAAPEARADYALTGKATGLGFATAAGAPVDPGDAGSVNIYNGFRFRSSRLYAASQPLPLAGVPLSTELAQGAGWIELDGLYLDLERGRPVALSGARLDAEGLSGRETHVITQVQHLGGVTRLILNSVTAHAYARDTLRINANVALASHGERVEEALGSGDARLAHQEFTLAKPPLTYVSAANAGGRASTLELRVDAALWSEVPALGQAGPEDAVYELRRDDDGTTRVRFGDGQHGRRLPTGALNVTAVYRSGLGRAGEVAAEAISQLKTRPLGIRAVVNPSAATGAADPEPLEAARQTAPGSVRTLGRIVSLSDYEDFATGFAGIGKAQARLLWAGQDKRVHLTVAPETDADLSPEDPVLRNLTEAVEALRDPACPVIIAPYARRLFAVSARLERDPAYRAEDVLLWAQALLETRFSYDARALAQPVSAAEVIAALHAVTGVLAADLDAFDLLLDGAEPTGGAGLQSVLPAAAASGPGRRGQGADFAPAQLLTILPSAIQLSCEEIRDA